MDFTAVTNNTRPHRLQNISDKAEFQWTSIKEKPLKLFKILTEFQANKAKNWQFFPMREGKT